MIATLLLSAQAAATAFAPPVDTPMRAVTEASRTDSGITRRFTSARRIVFRRAPQGYRAEVTIEAGDAEETGDDPAAMFRAGFSRIAGRTIVLHLDAKGRVVQVEDQAVIWKAFLDGIAALAPDGSSEIDRRRAGRIRAIVAAFAPLPADRQRATLASLVEPLIDADTAAEGESPPRAVRVPAGSAFGSAEIDGIRAVRRESGHLVVSMSATGEVTARGPEGSATGQITLETTRRVDPVTGLVLESRGSVRTEMPAAPAATRLTITRIRIP